MSGYLSPLTARGPSAKSSGLPAHRQSLVLLRDQPRLVSACRLSSLHPPGTPMSEVYNPLSRKLTTSEITTRPREEIPPAPSPATPRPAYSHAAFCANPESKLPAAKTASEHWIKAFLPKMSLSRVVITCVMVEQMRNDVPTQVMLCAASRSLAIFGSAVATHVWSRVLMKNTEESVVNATWGELGIPPPHDDLESGERDSLVWELWRWHRDSWRCGRSRDRASE